MLELSLIRLDLHGCSVKEARKRIAKLFEDAAETGIWKFYIITGRGNHTNSNGSRGVLKKLLPKMLAPFAEHIIQMDAEIGAFVVQMKKPVDNHYDDVLKKVFFNLLDPNEIKSSIQNWKIGAKQDDPEALFNLGLCYISEFLGDLNIYDRDQGLALLERASVLGKIEATRFLGIFFLNETEAYYQPAKAVQYISQAAKAGDISAQFQLAKCYLMGQGVINNDKLGWEWMKKAADAGHLDACFNLGKSFLNEDFTPVDQLEAVKYLSKAAFKGHPEAQSHLARCYATGEGVGPNDRMAFSLYSNAAQCDNVYALHQAGYYYSIGRGVERNPKKSFEFLNRAAELGDADSAGLVAMAYLNGNGVEQNKSEGIRRLKILAGKKHPASLFTLLHIYRIGILDIEPENAQKADEFLKIAAEANFRDAEWEWGTDLLRTKKDMAGFDFLAKALANRFISPQKSGASPLKLALQKFIEEKNIFVVNLLLACLYTHEEIGITLPRDWQDTEQLVIERARGGEPGSQLAWAFVQLAMGDKGQAMFWAVTASSRTGRPVPREFLEQLHKPKVPAAMSRAVPG